MNGHPTRSRRLHLQYPGRVHQGQMLPLLALALVVMIGVCGLVVDGLLVFQ